MGASTLVNTLNSTWARKHGVGAYDIHNPKEMKLFEPNMKVGPRTMPDMLPALCLAVEQPRCTNHQIRTTAIIYMRRSGLSWLTIAKITGHQSVENLIKYYDLSLEGPGLAEVVGALGQGHGVAKGLPHQKVVLKTRQPTEGPVKIEMGDSKKKVDEVKKKKVKKENVPPVVSPPPPPPDTSKCQTNLLPLPHTKPTTPLLTNHLSTRLLCIRTMTSSILLFWIFSVVATFLLN